MRDNNNNMDCDGSNQIEISQHEQNCIQIEGDELKENVDNDRDEKLSKAASVIENHQHHI